MEYTTISIGETQIYISEVVQNEDLLLQLYQLSENEKLTLEKYHNNRHRLQWLSYRLLLKNVLQEDFIIDYQPNGKPILRHPKKNISISHSFDYVAVALSNHAIGIDIEKQSSRILKLKTKIANEKEQQKWDMQDYRILHIIWGIKEAIYKKMDYPIKNYLTEITVTNIDFNQQTAQAEVQTVDSKKMITLSFCDYNNYMLVIAL